MAANDLLDYTFNNDGSFRIAINWHKATTDTWKKNIETNIKKINRYCCNDKAADRSATSYFV